MSKTNTEKMAPETQTPEMANGMKLDVRVRPIAPMGNLLAFANVTIGGCFKIDGFRICSSEKGLYVNMPATQDKGGNWKDVCWPVTAEFRKQLNDAGTEKQVSIYAKDYAGNRSDVVKLDNPYYKEPAPEKKPATTAPQSPSGTQTKPPKEEKPSGSNAATPSGGGNSSGSDNSTGQQENTSAIPEGAFTPEGTGTVQDNISGTDGEKQFYTITTDAGNVFYLVIDGKREDNNVYFLNGVTESDLMALAEKNNGSMSMIPQEESCNCTEKCEAGKVNTGCPVCKNDLNGCKGKEKPAETEKPAEPEKPKKETGSVGTILFILAALLAVGGIGYYVKIVRPKQQAEDDAEFEDDGYGEGFDPDEAYGEPEYLSEDDFDDKDSK